MLAIRFINNGILAFLFTALLCSQVIANELVNMSFKDAPAYDVLISLSKLTDKNLIISKDISGSISLHIKQLPWQQAFSMVLKSANLAMYQENNTIFVAQAAAILELRKTNLKLKQEEQVLVTRSIKLRHTQADRVAQIIFPRYLSTNPTNHSTTTHLNKHSNNGLLSNKGSIMVDSRTNAIILHDRFSHIEKITNLVSQLDIPLQQVMIKADIVVTKESIAEDIGINWLKNNGSSSYLLGTVTNGELEDTGIASMLIKRTSNTEDYSILNVSLSALEAEGKLKVVAQPKITAANGQAASISSGTEIPYVVTTADSVNTLFKQAVLSLQVTPNIADSGNIMIDLAITQDSVGDIYGNIPSIDTNSMQTRLLAQNKQTIVVGGLFTANSSTTTTKVPLLGDIPWLGWLFKSQTKKLDKAELLVFITPYLVDYH